MIRADEPCPTCDNPVTYYDDDINWFNCMACGEIWANDPDIDDDDDDDDDDDISALELIGNWSAWRDDYETP